MRDPENEVMIPLPICCGFHSCWQMFLGPRGGNIKDLRDWLPHDKKKAPIPTNKIGKTSSQ
jgi:hypothetical protein